MPSDNIKAITLSIIKVFENINSHICEIDQNAMSREEIVKAICNYVTQTVTAESKSLLFSFYSLMMDATLGKEPFITTKNKNKFYDYDIRSKIFEKYNFTTEVEINYNQVNEILNALPIPAGVLGIGVVLSIALSKAIIVPISVLIAGGVYYIVKEDKKKKNQAEFVSSIKKYLDSVKDELILWFENIEIYYNGQVEELKQSIKGEANA